MHWRVDEDAVRELVPDSLDLDTHDGSAWIGVTPFRVTGLRLHGLPPAPVLSSFPEVNVRTYVTYEDKPGIWFFSLDADSAWAVEAARLTYRLPYHHAKIQIGRRGELHRADIHHAPWPLQRAEAELRENTMSPVALEGEPLLHYSARQDVVIWALERL
jgi:uncharacterized protein YqjF (DUF2071 family)